MKRRGLLLGLLVLCVIALIVAGISLRTMQVSDGAKAFIYAAATCPDEELMNGQVKLSYTEENLEQIKEAASQILDRWEERVGQYFSEGGLYRTLVGANGLGFHYYAMENDVTVRVNDMRLLSRDARREYVLVTVLVDGEPYEIEMIFKYNPDGGFYQVDMILSEGGVDPT